MKQTLSNLLFKAVSLALLFTFTTTSTKTDLYKLSPKSAIPFNQNVFSNEEENLLKPDGQPYSVYGIFGRHKTKNDGKEQVEKIKEIVELARKFNKKIIFLKEEVPEFSYGSLGDTFKKVYLKNFKFTKEDLQDPKKGEMLSRAIYVFSSFYHTLGLDKQKFINLKRKLSKAKTEYIREDMEFEIEKLKKDLVSPKTLLERNRDPHGKKILEYLDSNEDIIEEFFVEWEVLDSLSLQKFLTSNFLVYHEHFGILKAKYSIETQSNILRDKALAQWIKREVDNKDNNNKIIIYTRGTVHAYNGILEEILGEKQKMVFQDKIDEASNPFWFRYRKILKNEDIIFAPENEFLQLQYVVQKHYLTQISSVQKEVPEYSILENYEIIQNLTKKQVEYFIENISSFKNYIDIFDWLRIQKTSTTFKKGKNLTPALLAEPFEIAL